MWFLNYSWPRGYLCSAGTRGFSQPRFDPLPSLPTPGPSSLHLSLSAQEQPKTTACYIHRPIHRGQKFTSRPPHYRRSPCSRSAASYIFRPCGVCEQVHLSVLLTLAIELDTKMEQVYKS